MRPHLCKILQAFGAFHEFVPVRERLQEPLELDCHRANEADGTAEDECDALSRLPGEGVVRSHSRSASKRGFRAPRTRVSSRFAKAVRTIGQHLDGIVAYVASGLSSARSEGTNCKVRTITRQFYGIHGASALIALIQLCCSGLALQPVHTRPRFHQT